VDSAAFVPCAELTLYGPDAPSDALALAVSRFTKALERVTGAALPQVWGGIAPSEGPLLVVGNTTSLAGIVDVRAWIPPGAMDSDVLSQSYVLSSAASTPGRLLAAGCGIGESPRAFLGLGYALGDLLQRVERRDDVWGFVLPAEPVVETPAMPNRTVYLMNSEKWQAPGLSFDYGNTAQLEGFVDALVNAKFSRIAFWQWYAIYLYPTNREDRRAENLRIHQGMRHLLDYGRKRGLEIIHMLTPMHANPDLLPDDPKYVATGYYGRTSVCWAQPEARQLARYMARHEMEYYGPVDGYVCWFYDPGGCFCEVCRRNQGKHLTAQFELVKELAATVSPTAELQACLWPTWCFHEEQWGIDFPEKDVHAFVKEFLAAALESCGPRQLTILDSCDTSFDNYAFNIYSGIVDPSLFKRNGFMHRVLGTPGEASYVFAPFAFRFLEGPMRTALDRHLDEAMLSVIYTTPSYPSLYAFGEMLYSGNPDGDAALRGYAATVAKGTAYAPMVALLTALEDRAGARTYEAMDAAISRAEEAWAQLEAHPDFYGDRNWLKGYVRAQRFYYRLARAETEAAYSQTLAELRAGLIEIPTYTDYVKHTLTPEIIARFHLPMWRGPVGDSSAIGTERAVDDKWIGVPDVYREES